MAGHQDNGTIRFTGSTVWDHIADGDGRDCGVNQLNPNIVYHSFYRVSLERSVNKGNTWTNLSPTSVPSFFYPPVEVSGSTVAIGGTSLVVTRTGAGPWTTFSLGLASNEAVGHAPDRRQHDPGRHQSGSHGKGELDGRHVEQGVPDLAHATLHQLHRGGPEQPAACVGDHLADRRTRSLPLGQSGR